MASVEILSNECASVYDARTCKPLDRRRSYLICSASYFECPSFVPRFTIWNCGVGLNSRSWTSSRRPSAPTYETETVLAAPNACSIATFHSCVYGSFKLGSAATRKSAGAPGAIVGGASRLVSAGKETLLNVRTAVNGKFWLKLLITAELARS